jgi:hypothetical protein
MKSNQLFLPFLFFINEKMNMKNLSCLLFFMHISGISYCQYPDAATIKKNKIKIIEVSSYVGTDHRLYDENGYAIKGAYDDIDFKSPNWTNTIFYNKKGLPDSIIGKYRNDHYKYFDDGSFIIISIDKNESDTAFYAKDKKIKEERGSDGSKTKYEYNTKGQLIKSTNTHPEGKSVTTYLYNALGLMQSEKTTGDCKNGICISVLYTYDKNGLLIKEVVDRGSGSKFTTDYAYISFYGQSQSPGQLKTAAATAAPKGPAVYIIPGINNSTGKYVLMDSFTMKQYGTEEYQETGETKNNLVYMYKDWHYGLIKKTGEMIVNPDTSKYIRIEDELDSAGNYLAILLDKNVKNKFGGYLLLNKQYKPITSRSYGIIMDYENGYYLTRKYFPGTNEESYYGLVSKTGKEVLKPEYKLIRRYPKEKLIVTTTHDNKHGLYNYAGKQLLPDEYNYFDEMDITENRLIVMKKGEFSGLIDKTGKIVVPLKYNYLSYHDYGKDSYYEIGLNGKIGTLNTAGKEVIPPQYTFLYPMFDEGCAIFNASKDEINNGWIDKTGKVVLPLIYKADVPCPGEEGLSRARISDSSYVFVNKLGQQVFGKKFSNASGFNNGLAYVQEKDKYGIINNKGVYVVQPEYEKISQVWETDMEMFAVKKDGKWGFMDKSAKMVVPPTYDEPNDEGYGYSDISEGLIAVKQNGKWGFIDNKGNVIIPFLYDSASLFREGRAEVELNNETFSIDKKGIRTK